jgi:hypothetical protein
MRTFGELESVPVEDICSIDIDLGVFVGEFFWRL